MFLFLDIEDFAYAVSTVDDDIGDFRFRIAES